MPRQPVLSFTEFIAESARQDLRRLNEAKDLVETTIDGALELAKKDGVAKWVGQKLKTDDIETVNDKIVEMLESMKDDASASMSILKDIQTAYKIEKIGESFRITKVSLPDVAPDDIMSPEETIDVMIDRKEKSENQDVVTPKTESYLDLITVTYLTLFAGLVAESQKSDPSDIKEFVAEALGNTKLVSTVQDMLGEIKKMVKPEGDKRNEASGRWSASKLGIAPLHEGFLDKLKSKLTGGDDEVKDQPDEKYPWRRKDPFNVVMAYWLTLEKGPKEILSTPESEKFLAWDEETRLKYNKTQNKTAPQVGPDSPYYFTIKDGNVIPLDPDNKTWTGEEIDNSDQSEEDEKAMIELYMSNHRKLKDKEADKAAEELEIKKQKSRGSGGWDAVAFTGAYTAAVTHILHH